MRPDGFPLDHSTRAIAGAIAAHATLTDGGGVDPSVLIPTTSEIAEALDCTRYWVDVIIHELVAAGAIIEYPALPTGKAPAGEAKRRRITIDTAHEAWDGLLPGDYLDDRDQGPGVLVFEEPVL